MSLNGDRLREHDDRFVAVAAAALDGLLESNPELATELGDHRFDGRLSDSSPAALDERSRQLSAHLWDLDALDLDLLSMVNRVDLEILRARLMEQQFALDVLREHEWNPLVANPGTGIYLLLARDFAPLPDRLRAVASRLAAVPAALQLSRQTLHDMPRVHVETALVQFAGTAALLTGEVEQALAAEPALRREVEAPRSAALAALGEHRRWLESQLPTADGDPRLGTERFAAKLALALDTAMSADEVLARAEEDLVRVSAKIEEVAAGLGGSVREVLDDLASDHPSDETILPRCQDALAETTAFVQGRELVTDFGDPIEVIAMPEIHRGVAVAYCDPPGPLETAALPTFLAVAPTPADWPASRVESFYREYNAAMVHNLVIHEAMPGHVLQLDHARRFSAPTRVRAACWSGPFVEGWAVYAEALMAQSEYGGARVRIQQLKMQLRMVINAILDIRVHAHGMTEDEAMTLMMQRGYQEEGEAVGKWRRALLTSAQLATYYVGFVEVQELVRDLRAARPGASEREIHDAVLGFGSPPPRHLWTLLGL
jgi:uncharacterized protein (DUF885 family)